MRRWFVVFVVWQRCHLSIIQAAKPRRMRPADEGKAVVDDAGVEFGRLRRNSEAAEESLTSCLRFLAAMAFIKYPRRPSPE